MSEEHPHPLLQQLPLTVSPYLSLPTATPLPYAYKSLPSTLPPSVIDPQQQGGPDTHSKPEYVISAAGGHSAHPDSIIESCRALRAHLERMQADSEAAIRRWDGDVKAKELAERRRVAPGWLDVGEESRMLVPERPRSEMHEAPGDGGEMEGVVGETKKSDEGDALDRAFGGLNVQS